MTFLIGDAESGHPGGAFGCAQNWPSGARAHAAQVHLAALSSTASGEEIATSQVSPKMVRIYYGKRVSH